MNGWQKAFAQAVSSISLAAFASLGLTMLYWLIKFLFLHDCK